MSNIHAVSITPEQDAFLRREGLKPSQVMKNAIDRLMAEKIPPLPPEVEAKRKIVEEIQADIAAYEKSMAERLKALEDAKAFQEAEMKRLRIIRVINPLGQFQSFSCGQCGFQNRDFEELKQHITNKHGTV